MVEQRKNPAELPASRSNSGAGTEKRPYGNDPNNTDLTKCVKFKIRKNEEFGLSLPSVSRPAPQF
jgi:hypothetical protein